MRFVHRIIQRRGALAVLVGRVEPPPVAAGLLVVIIGEGDGQFLDHRTRVNSQRKRQRAAAVGEAAGRAVFPREAAIAVVVFNGDIHVDRIDHRVGIRLAARRNIHQRQQHFGDLLRLGLVTRCRVMHAVLRVDILRGVGHEHPTQIKNRDVIFFSHRHHRGDDLARQHRVHRSQIGVLLGGQRIVGIHIRAGRDHNQRIVSLIAIGVDQFLIVCRKGAASPHIRLGVVAADVDDDHVRLVGKAVLIHPLIIFGVESVDIAPLPPLGDGCAGIAEILDLAVVAEDHLQIRRVAVPLCPLGGRRADTRDLQRFAVVRAAAIPHRAPFERLHTIILHGRCHFIPANVQRVFGIQIAHADIPVGILAADALVFTRDGEHLPFAAGHAVIREFAEAAVVRGRVGRGRGALAVLVPRVEVPPVVAARFIVPIIGHINSEVFNDRLFCDAHLRRERAGSELEVAGRAVLPLHDIIAVEGTIEIADARAWTEGDRRVLAALGNEVQLLQPCRDHLRHLEIAGVVAVYAVAVPLGVSLGRGVEIDGRQVHLRRHLGVGGAHAVFHHRLGDRAVLAHPRLDDNDHLRVRIRLLISLNQLFVIRLKGVVAVLPVDRLRVVAAHHDEHHVRLESQAGFVFARERVRQLLAGVALLGAVVNDRAAVHAEVAHIAQTAHQPLQVIRPRIARVRARTKGSGGADAGDLRLPAGRALRRIRRQRRQRRIRRHPAKHQQRGQKRQSAPNGLFHAKLILSVSFIPPFYTFSCNKSMRCGNIFLVTFHKLLRRASSTSQEAFTNRTADRGAKHGKRPGGGKPQHGRFKGIFRFKAPVPAPHNCASREWCARSACPAASRASPHRVQSPRASTRQQNSRFYTFS